jgi:hypothetical protein
LIKTKGIVKEEPVCLNYQSVDDLVQLIKTKGIVKEEPVCLNYQSVNCTKSSTD